MIRCIAIDDEPLALQQISSYIEKTPNLELIKSFSNAVQALTFLHDHAIDLMFVDINMPDLSGMEFVKSLSDPPKVIFTTAYREYAVEGFQVDAADYLLKPISFSAFLQAFEKVRDRYFTNSAQSSSIKSDEKFLFIKMEHKIIRIELNRIKFIEGMRDYVRFHLEGEKPIMALLNMKSIEEYLKTDNFMRVHRSYIVNLDKITRIERNRIIFDSTYIPISDLYKEEFQKYIDGNFLK